MHKIHINKKIAFLLISIILISSILFINKNNLTSTTTATFKSGSSVSSDKIVVSVIGDSISTFNYDAYTGAAYKVVGSYYYDTATGMPGSPRGFTNGWLETWWGRFITTKGFTLGVNASYGGSKITNIPNVNIYTGLSIPSFCDSTRLDYLDDRGTPDFIFIFGGMNDLINLCGSGQSYATNGCVELGNYSSYPSTTFIGAYVTMLNSLKSKYPNSKLVIIVPYNYGNNTRGGYTEISSAIKTIANNNGISYVDLGTTILNGTTSSENMINDDGLYIHPNTYGMEKISNAILNSGIDFSVTAIDAPSCNNLTYNGSPQNLVNSSGNYTLSNTTTATNVGTYQVTVTPKAGYQWSDGTRKESKPLSCKINAKNISGVSISNISDQTYTGSSITPSPTITLDSKTLTKDTDYTLSYSNNTNAGTATITITGKGNYTGTKSTTFKINGIDISKATVSSISDQTYTGSAITPNPTVTLNSKTLTKDTDYTLSYSNNTNAGTATITITGKGGYYGTLTITFKITVINISELVISNISDQTYTGNAITPNPTVKLNSKILTKDTDYTLNYENNTDIGTATITIVGRGNCTGSKNINFKIVKGDISIAIITTILEQQYTGSAITPNLTVTLNSKTLIKDIDYTLSYSNNTDIGTATITITGKENYIGEKEIAFKIVKADINNIDVTISNQTYTGSAITPNPTVKLNSKTLTKDTDYTLSYENNTDIGIATIIITGKGNYTNSKRVNFNIVGIDISHGDMNNISNQTYSGQEIKPEPIVVLNSKILTKDIDYSINYSNNINVGTATMTITGKGIYAGIIKKTFEIVPYNISNISVEDIPKQKLYTESVTPNIIVKLDSKILIKDVDYTLVYENNKSVGMAKAIITGKGNYTGRITKTFEIIPKSSNKKLNSLTINGEEILKNLYIKVDNSINKINIDATAADSLTTIEGLGEKELNKKINLFKIVVTAEDGSQKTYKVIVVKEEPENSDVVLSTNKNMKLLAVEGFNLTPEFSKETYNYELEVENNVSKINLLATPEDDKAYVFEDGLYELKEGVNELELIISSESGDISRYYINVTRKTEMNQISENETEENIEEIKNEDNPPTGTKKIGIYLVILTIIASIIYVIVKKKKYLY